jgi:WD40 repeat protein
MIKYILILFLSTNLFAIKDLEPNKIFKASGTVQSIVYKDNKLYGGTSNGTVEIFDVKTTKKIKTIKLPQIKDFIGDIIPAKVYSIDLFEDKILIVSQGMKGYRNIFLYENEELEKIIDIKEKYYVNKASFISDKKIVFALLSNQIGVYNFKQKKLDYLIQVSPSAFSYFMIAEDKKTIASTDESGKIRVIDLETTKVINEPKALNLDKVYQLDYKNGIILTAGQDRKSVVYNGILPYYFDFDFLLYSCGLSPKAKLGAIAYNEENEVLVFDVKTKKKLYNLTKQKATLTQILFINENEVFTSSDDSNINYFKLN